MLIVKVCIFMLAAALALNGAATIYGDLVAKAGYTSDETPRRIAIGSDIITIPANMIRFRSQRQATTSSRLDIFAHWPSMRGHSADTATDFNSTAEDASILFMSLEPRETSRDMTARLSPIYEKFLSGPPVDAGHGLVRRPFSDDSAYVSEDLYYEAESPYPYAVRCIRDDDKVAVPFCMRDIHIGNDLSLTYRFHARFLSQWMEIERSVHDRVTAMLIR